MAFTAKDVAKLREMTGAGMMDCKKALSENDGDMDKAVEFLREKGLAAAAKKAGRIAAEGMVHAVTCPETGIGVVIEVNSETDFVAKNADFQKFVKDLAAVVMKEDPADVDALKACQYLDTGRTVEEMLQEKILVIGENQKIRRFVRYADGVNVPYIHMGGKIGVMVNMKVSEGLEKDEKVQELGRDIAMQIAAMNPQWLKPEEVDPAVLAKEKEILLQQTVNEGKPEKIAEKIVAGRINKFYEEVCLLNQPFVKENKVSVQKHVEQVAKELGGSIEVVKYTRFEKGEGLEKRSDNFADEVAGMIK